MGLILSIDVGTTNIKAALVDATGMLVGEAKSINMKIEGDAVGRAEHDPIKLQSALLDVCKMAIGNRGHDVELFALTSYMFGLILLDASLRPLTKVSTFLDTTSQAQYPQFLKAVGDVDGMYLRTGCPPIFQYPVSRLHHIAATQPEVRNKTAHVLDSKSFLMHALTGQFCTDYSTASSLGCLNIDGTWDRPVVEATGFRVEQFPQVVNGFLAKLPLTEAVCRELGVKTGTAVSAGLYDGAALAAAMTGFEEKIAVGNFGTSGMFRVPTRAPIEDLGNGLIQSCLLAPGTFFTGAGINNCTIATNLLLNVLDLNLDYLRGQPLSVPGSHGVMTFPYFTGERDMVIGNIGTGVVFGLGIASSRDDLARSFLEGVAFSFLLVKERLDPRNEIAEFRMGGGGAANLQWMQIMADTLNLPIRLTQNPEMGIIGAACVARHGEGEALRESSRQVMQGAKVIEPIAANVAVYREVAERYFDVRSSLREPLLARQGLSPLRSAKKPASKEIPLVREIR